MVAKDWFLPQLLWSFDLLIQDWLGSSEGFLEVRQPMQDEGRKPLSVPSGYNQQNHRDIYIYTYIYIFGTTMKTTLIISSHSSCSSCVGAGRVMYFPILHVQWSEVLENDDVNLPPPAYLFVSCRFYWMHVHHSHAHAHVQKYTSTISLLNYCGWGLTISKVTFYRCQFAFQLCQCACCGNSSSHAVSRRASQTKWDKRVMPESFPGSFWRGSHSGFFTLDVFYWLSKCYPLHVLSHWKMNIAPLFFQNRGLWACEKHTEIQNKVIASTHFSFCFTKTKKQTIKLWGRWPRWD